MKEIANISAFLMEKDIEIAKFNIEIYERFVMINDYDVLNAALLPPVIKTIGMLNWLLSRCMSYTTHWQAYLCDSILQSGERNPYAPFILSLNSNSASLTDWYWLQPTSDCCFSYFGQKIVFNTSQWNNVSWFANWKDISSFNCYMHKDVYDYNTYVQPIKTPIFVISGESQNQIITNGESIWLKQRKSEHRIQNEIKCLSELNHYGIITPKIETAFIDATRLVQNDDSQRSVFDYYTKQHGMHFVIKRLMTDENHKLIALSWFGQQINASSMSDIVDNIEQLCNMRIANKDAAKFIDRYVRDNAINGIDGSNIGFLCDENYNMRIAVWSNIEVI